MPHVPCPASQPERAQTPGQSRGQAAAHNASHVPHRASPRNAGRRRRRRHAAPRRACPRIRTEDRCRSVLCDSLLPALAAVPRAACARITAQSSSATRHAAPIITSHYSSRRFSMHQALGTDPGTLQAGRAPPPLRIYTHLVDAARPPGQPSATRQHAQLYIVPNRRTHPYNAPCTTRAPRSAPGEHHRLHPYR
jgi:hypothetical protein